jgi:AAA+ ATPase superfamily predicted ATPase
MAEERAKIRVNPGGGLDPSQVWDRDEKIAEMWRTLDRPQSVYLTGERRSGKTSILKKMKANLPAGASMVYTDVEDVNTPGEFANKLFVKVSEELPAVTKARGWLVRKLKDLGITKISAAGIGIEFGDTRERQWGAVIRQVVEALQRMDDQRVVLVFDELPQMLTNIAERGQPLDARQVLDTLRELRQSSGQVQMIFTGSIGLHHVVKQLTEAGGTWAPINDMAVIDVTPLDPVDAIGLAHELIVNENIRTEDGAGLAQAIAEKVDGAPFYIQQVVAALTNRRASDPPADSATVDEIINDKLQDPQDDWKFAHFVNRMKPYYGAEEPLASTILDIVAADGPLAFGDLMRLLPAHLEIGEHDADRVAELLDLLQSDYYLIRDRDGRLRYRQPLLARAWRARRYR